MLADTDLIRNLLARYGELLDAGDFEAVGALFADGSLCGPDGTPFASGAAEVAAFYRAGTKLHRGSPCTKHLITNPIVEEPEPDGSVTVRSTYVVFQATDTLALQPIIAGRYVDRFARAADGSWSFSERRFLVDLVGNLTQHLVDPAAAEAGGSPTAGGG